MVADPEGSDAFTVLDVDSKSSIDQSALVMFMGLDSI